MAVAVLQKTLFIKTGRVRFRLHTPVWTMFAFNDLDEYELYPNRSKSQKGKQANSKWSNCLGSNDFL